MAHQIITTKIDKQDGKGGFCKSDEFKLQGLDYPVCSTLRSVYDKLTISHNSMLVIEVDKCESIKSET